jgi:hypothetical protein
VTRCDGVTTLARGEVALEMEKRGDDTSWVNVNFTGQKIKKINAVDSTGTNER